jgi:hypothetical protein
MGAILKRAHKPLVVSHRPRESTRNRFMRGKLKPSIRPDALALESVNAGP